MVGLGSLGGLGGNVCGIWIVCLCDGFIVMVCYFGVNMLGIFV